MNDSCCLCKELRAAEISRLQGKPVAGRIDAVCPGNAWIDLIAKRAHADPERVDDRPGGLAASHDEVANARLGKTPRDATERAFHVSRCSIATEHRLHSVDSRRIRRRINQE